MVLHRNQPSSSSPSDAVPVAGLVRTDWVLSVCVVCGHECPHGERDRASCPACGAAAPAGGWCGRRVARAAARARSSSTGLRGAVGGIVELYRSLEAQLVVISTAATASRRERRVHGRRWRNSFLLGAVARIGQRLDARCVQTGESGRALVLVKPAVDCEIEPRHAELDRSGYRASVARGAYEAGSRAGKQVDLGDRRVGRSSPPLPDAAAG